jgi:hypothetical protein
MLRRACSFAALCLTAAGVLLSAGAAAGQETQPIAANLVVNPHLTTDRTVDTSSPEAMVRSLVKPGMSDQEKAIAIYNFVRRTMFHYRYLTDFGGGGTMDLINGTGYCLCTPTASTQARLTRLAGVNAHVLTTPGHGSVCVQWDGKWRWMDAFIGACVWNKDRTTIATLDEILSDTSLIRRENPSPVPFFPCGAVLYEDALRWEPTNEKYHKDCGPDDLAWTERAKPGDHSPMTWDDRSSLAITLRPGETYTRPWDHEPGMFFLFKTEDKYAPPHHLCGIEAEQRDTVNWPYFKPYVKEIASTDARTQKPCTVKTGRYWANGRLTWKPDLASPNVLRDFAAARNVRVDTKAHVIEVEKADGPAVLEWAVKCPYMLQGGYFQAACVGDVRAAINVRPASGAAADEFAPLERAAAGENGVRPQGSAPIFTGDVLKRADLRPHFARKIGTRNYTLRLELRGQGARVGQIELVTIFQHNMYALPQLMPGRNEVTVTAAQPATLKNTPFVLEYAWDEPDVPGRLHVERRMIDRSPYTFDVTVPGPDLPRMRHLLFANEGAPLNREP